MAPGLCPAANPVFAAIVHTANPVQDVSVAELKAIFSGVVRQWPDHAPIVLAEREDRSGPAVFLSPYKSSLVHLGHQAEGPVLLKILNSDAAACDFVFNVPRAVAVIEAGSLSVPACSQVRVLRIKGRLPLEPGYLLKGVQISPR